MEQCGDTLIQEQSWREQTQAYVAAVYAAHPELRPEEPKKPAPIINAALQAENERQAKIDALCAELEALQASSDPFLGTKLARATAKAYGVTWQEMVSNQRCARFCKARNHAMWLMRKHTTLSLPHIGKILGGRDHTTIIHGLRVHEKRIAAGEVFPCGL